MLNDAIDIAQTPPQRDFATLPPRVGVSTLPFEPVGLLLKYRPLPQGDGSATGARKGSRAVFFRDIGMTECPCYDRALLLAGDSLCGPVLIEATDSTTVVPPGWAVRCDSIGNLMITR